MEKKNWKEVLENGRLYIARGVVATAGLFLYGMCKSYRTGIQSGCDALFGAITANYPTVNFSDFYEKYHN